MADRTPIDQIDTTWNPIVGCSVVSPGCTNCYAMRLAGTRLKHHPSRAGLTTETKAGPVWTGETRLDERALLQPLRWRRPRKIFACAHSDLFHEATPDEWIDRVFAIMALCPQHTFQVLTKRPERMRAYLLHPTRSVDVGLEALGIVLAEHAKNPRSNTGSGCMIKATDINPGALTIWPLPNIWLGVTAERQQEADTRIPLLLRTPAARRFVSIEPMLGAVDLTLVRAPDDNDDGEWKFSALDTGDYYCERAGENQYGGAVYSGGDGPYREHRLDWVIVGGESGPGARPMHPDWVRDIRDQCAAAVVPFLFKQWGEWAPGEICGPNDRSIDVADWFDDRWSFYRVGRARDDDHIDDEPTLFRVGKRAAGRTLDGIEHTEFPEEISHE